MRKPVKQIVFKTIYLLATIAVICFGIYVAVVYLMFGSENSLTFDDVVNLITLVVACMFEVAIITFIVRSYKNPTILMKNLVFKRDGTPYLFGIILILVGCLITGGLFVLFLCAYLTKSFFTALNPYTLLMLMHMMLALFMNLFFTELYFLTFKHEAGTFAII